MATSKKPKRPAKKPAAKPAGKGLTADEKAAMRDRMREAKAEAAGKNDESAVLEKIAEMSPTDRAVAERLHALVKATAPELAPKTWYGMPAYARDGKVLLYLQPGERFKSRYATLGFSDQARLDDGAMWPVAFAIDKLGDAEAKRIAALVQRALGRA